MTGSYRYRIHPGTLANIRWHFRLPSTITDEQIAIVYHSADHINDYRESEDHMMAEFEKLGVVFATPQRRGSTDD